MMYVGDSAGPVAVNAIGTQLHYLILADSGTDPMDPMAGV